MNDIDIMLIEAEQAIEAAGARQRVARDALVKTGLVTRGDLGEVEGAGADLYDAGIDLVIELRRMLNATRVALTPTCWSCVSGQGCTVHAVTT